MAKKVRPIVSNVFKKLNLINLLVFIPHSVYKCKSYCYSSWISQKYEKHFLKIIL